MALARLVRCSTAFWALPVHRARRWRRFNRGGAAPTAVPASLVAGATGDVVATFTPGTTLTQDGKIVIEFPASFHAVAATSVTTSGLTGTVAVATSGKTITITRQVRGASKVEEQ